MYKKMTAVFCTIVLMFTFVFYRIYSIMSSGSIVSTAAGQGVYSLDIANTRGLIYDRNFAALVGGEYEYVASVMPTFEAQTKLMQNAAEEEREALITNLQNRTPFIMPLEDKNIFAKGIDVFKVPVRYLSKEKQAAPHIVGYLSGDGLSGVAGIEKSYDDFLRETGTDIKVRYTTDAWGGYINGSSINVERVGGDEPVGGVVLTLDKRIQLIAENALKRATDKGAAVVMDIYSGDILAMVSLPEFDQADIAASFESEDAPFVNRALSGYNIGSAFKIIVSAAAIESGIPETYTYRCDGIIEAEGLEFRCNNHAIHGEIDMQKALQVSCNTYFINLAKQINPSYMIAFTKNMGLGSPIELAPSIKSQAGNLPHAEELSSTSAYANFSFGQGSSLATPLQMARAVAVIANTGISVNPHIVKGFTLDGMYLAESVPVYSANQVITEKTARTVKALMTGVVSDGSGRTATPISGGAGGKTSSAQTGIINPETGEEIVHAWFAGFYPAESPQYSIVVLAEGGVSGENVAAPVFKHIADGISGLDISED